MIFDRAVGIDLGTTNSEAAWLPPSEREIVLYKDRFGRRTFASAVAWDEKEQRFVVGHPARARRTAEEPPVESIKRKMGQRTKVPCGPHMLTPEEISAKILASLVEALREQLAAGDGGPGTLPLTRAVITVPAYFDAPQVEATRKAGEIAGLEVIGILQEPTAAAIYQTWKHPEISGDRTFLVYDLGGGTFDVSILRSLGGEYQVVALDGDNFLGGDDLDRAFAEHLRKQLVAQGFALDLEPSTDLHDRVRFLRLMHLAQEIKESLTMTEVVHVAKTELLRDKNGAVVPFEADIGRAEYEAVISPLVEQTIACCERALAEAEERAGLRLEDLDHVVLVGGSTRVPLVVRRVIEALCAKTKGQRPPLQDDVDTCVALGAAVHASSLGGLRVMTDDKAASLLFSTPLLGQSATLPLRFVVEKAPAGSKQIALWDGEDILGEAAVPEGERPTIALTVTLPEEPEKQVTFAFQNAVAMPLAEFQIPLHRGDLRPRPTALTRAAVVAKDIGIEVVRAGRRDRRVVLAKGTGLPTQASTLLFTVDQSGAVVLRLLQNRLPIKTLIIDVPKDLPIGSPVEVTIRCDESMRIEARALVANQEVQAIVEAPDTLAFDPKGQLDALLEESESASRALWGHSGQAFQERSTLLVGQIRDAARINPDKLPQLSGQLRDLIDEFKGGSGDVLAPPLEKYEERMGRLKRIAYRVETSLAGMSRDQWEARIESLDDKAHAAFATNDAATWRRVNNEVQALLETATQEEWSRVDISDPNYLRTRLSNVSAWAFLVRRKLEEQVTTAPEELRAAQNAERARIEGRLREVVEPALASLHGSEGIQKSTKGILDKLIAAEEELERLEVACERLPQMGLVTDRGAK
jgi:molecular chaperone DnaK